MEKKADKILRIFNRLYNNDNYKKWRNSAYKCLDFRMGNQIPKEIAEKMREINRVPIVINKIHPAVELVKTLMTYNKPRFQVFPRESSDVDVADIINQLMEYVWNISDGNSQLKLAIDDYLVKGKGYLALYFDPLADNNKGEVKIRYIDSMEVFVDPFCNDRYERDASYYFIYKAISRDRAKFLYPEHKKIIDDAPALTGGSYSDIASDTDKADYTITKRNTQGDPESDFIAIIEAYEPVYLNFYHVVDKVKNNEEILTEEELEEFLNKNIYVLVLPNEDIIYSDSIDEINDALFKLLQNVGEGAEDQIREYLESNPIKSGKIADLVDAGYVDYVEITKKRIKRTVLIGDKIIGEEIMPISDYPIVPLPNIWNGTPFTMSDVEMAMPLQEALNKLMSLIIAHIQKSVNLTLKIPKGSVRDVEALRDELANSVGIIEYDPNFGIPDFAIPPSLSAEVFHLIAQIENEINYQFGVFELSHGDVKGAPSTVRGTLLLDEYGQRRAKSKLDDIEDALNILGRVLIEMIQGYYTHEKVITIVNPQTGEYSKIEINKPIEDEFTGEEIDRAMDVTRGSYDVIVVSGSTLPTNRMAKLEYMMELYDRRLVTPKAVLDVVDIPNKDKMLQEMDMTAQYETIIAQLQEEIKKLKGDLQTAQRETMHAKQKAELSKFQAQLKKHEAEIKAMKDLTYNRLLDLIENVKKESKLREGEK